MGYFNCEECNKCKIWDGYRTTCLEECMKPLNALDEYKEYKRLEEQGLLLRPKCRLGDVVYALWSITTESKYVVYQAEVKEINLSSTNVRKMLMYKLEPIAFRGRYNKYYDDDFGKLVFMSQEEAEQALKEKNEPKEVAYQIDTRGHKHEKCPACGSFHVFGKHCTECGQSIVEWWQ